MGVFSPPPPPRHIPDHRWPWLPWRWQPAQHRQSSAVTAGSGGKHAGNTSTRRALPVTLCRSGGEQQSGNVALSPSFLPSFLPSTTCKNSTNGKNYFCFSFFKSNYWYSFTVAKRMHSQSNKFPPELKISSRVGIPGYNLRFPSRDSAPICQQTTPAGMCWCFFLSLHACQNNWSSERSKPFSKPPRDENPFKPGESGMTTGSPIT